MCRIEIVVCWCGSMVVVVSQLGDGGEYLWQNCLFNVLAIGVAVLNLVLVSTWRWSGRFHDLFILAGHLGRYLAILAWLAACVRVMCVCVCARLDLDSHLDLDLDFWAQLR